MTQSNSAFEVSVTSSDSTSVAVVSSKARAHSFDLLVVFLVAVDDFRCIARLKTIECLAFHCDMLQMFGYDELK